MTTANPDQNPGDNVENLKWLYSELLRIERHWTAQVQDQQQRISTLLTVTGILLAFLAGAGFLAKLLDVSIRLWPVYVYIASMISLCFALFMGTSALKPNIPIAGAAVPASPKAIDPHAPREGEAGALGEAWKFLKSLALCFRPVRTFEVKEAPVWLNQVRVLEIAKSRSEESFLRELCESAAENQKKANIQNTLKTRRILMYRQFAFLMMSLSLLIVALGGVLITHSGCSQCGKESSVSTAHR